jgi:hypothetical protein
LFVYSGGNKEIKIKVMTKREIQRLHREQFFTAVCEKYPGTVIDSDGSGEDGLSIWKMASDLI